MGARAVLSHALKGPLGAARGMRGLGAARSGLASIEFAVIAPVLTLLLIGVFDFGRGLWYQMQVATAAQAGAVYAASLGWDATAAAIETAITSATNIGVSASPAPAWVCGCPNAAAGIVSTQCGTACPDGSSPPHYVIVGAKIAYSPLLHYPAIPASLNLSYTSYARLYP